MILVANQRILHENVEYDVGDAIPMAGLRVETVTEWIRAGSAVLVDGIAPKKAMIQTATPGRTGSATGVGDILGDDLVGRIPRRI